MKRHIHSGRKLLGLTLAIITAVMWGVIPIGLKMLVQWMSVYTISWCRFFISALVVFPIVIRRYGFRNILNIRKLPVLMLICAAVLIGNNLLYQASLRYITPGTAQVLLQFTPLVVLVGGLVIYKEVFIRAQWLGIGILIAGMILFFNPRYKELLFDIGNYTLGVVLSVISAVLFGAYLLIQKQLLVLLAPETILLVVYIVGIIVLFPLAKPGILFELESYQLVVLAVVSIMTFVSYWSFAESMKHIEASRSSVVLALTPLITVIANEVFAFILPHLLVSESLNALSVLGAVFVVAGSMTVAIVRSRQVPGGSTG